MHRDDVASRSAARSARRSAKRTCASDKHREAARHILFLQRRLFAVSEFQSTPKVERALQGMHWCSVQCCWMLCDGLWFDNSWTLVELWSNLGASTERKVNQPHDTPTGQKVDQNQRQNLTKTTESRDPSGSRTGDVWDRARDSVRSWQVSPSATNVEPWYNPGYNPG